MDTGSDKAARSIGARRLDSNRSLARPFRSTPDKMGNRGQGDRDGQGHEQYPRMRAWRDIAVERAERTNKQIERRPNHIAHTRANADAGAQAVHPDVDGGIETNADAVYENEAESDDNQHRNDVAAAFDEKCWNFHVSEQFSR